jgi:hypothetical protein
MAWTVTCEPVGENPGKLKKALAERSGGTEKAENIGGIVVYLTNGSKREEFSRVAFIRRVSRNPGTKLRDQLDKEIKEAQEACDKLNELLSGKKAGELA